MVRVFGDQKLTYPTHLGAVGIFGSYYLGPITNDVVMFSKIVHVRSGGAYGEHSRALQCTK